MNLPQDELSKLKKGKKKDHTTKPAKVQSSGMLMRLVSNESRGDSYCMVIWFAASIGLSHVLLGAVIVSIIIYSQRYAEPHAAVYAIAYHFFTAESILTLSYVNGWSTPMRWKHRKYVHAFLQICAVICSIIGTVGIVRNKGNTRSLHGLSGLITLVLTGLAFLIGPFALKKVPKAHVVHMTFGIPCFFTSSLCLCSGLFKEEFKKWCGKSVVIILFIFVVFYSFFIIVTTSIKYIQKL